MIKLEITEDDFSRLAFYLGLAAGGSPELTVSITELYNKLATQWEIWANPTSN
jgi:hypothetical protein